MALNDPIKPDELKSFPAAETPSDDKSAPKGQAVENNDAPPAPEMAAEEAATLTQEAGKALRDIGEEQLEPPTPFDIPHPGDVVVSSDKINEIVNEKKEAAQEDNQPEAEAPERKPARRGRPPKEDRGDKPEKEPEAEKPGKVVSINKGAAAKDAPEEEKAPDGPSLKERKQKLEQELREKYNIPKSDKPVEPWVAPEVEQVVRIPHEKIHSFKDHPFNIEKDSKYMAFVASIRAHGVTQPAVIRPDGKDGYEMISGHRRNEGSKDAEIPFTPCIIRALNDEQAIQQMVEDNVNNRDIGTMELARALNMQLDSIKRQGARDALSGKDLTADTNDSIMKRSNEIIAERNGMSVKQVQRHIALTRLVPALQELVDGKAINGDKTLKLAFTPAVELSYVKPKNQEYVAVAVEGQQSTPSLSQAQRMRQLDEKNLLNPDMIDGIMLEEKKEVSNVIISSQELSQYFGKDKTPRDMKDQIIKLLDEWAGKEKELTKPDKKIEQEK